MFITEYETLGQLWTAYKVDYIVFSIALAAIVVARVWSINKVFGVRLAVARLASIWGILISLLFFESVSAGLAGVVYEWARSHDLSFTMTMLVVFLTLVGPFVLFGALVYALRPALLGVLNWVPWVNVAALMEQQYTVICTFSESRPDWYGTVVAGSDTPIREIKAIGCRRCAEQCEVAPSEVSCVGVLIGKANILSWGVDADEQ